MNLQLTNDRDLDFSAGQLQLIEGNDEVRQKLEVRYRFFKGEWVLDERVGMPYYQEIFGKGRDINIIRAYMLKAALTCPGIASVSEFDIEIDVGLRQLQVEMTAILTSGEILDFSEAFVLGGIL